MLSQAYIIRLFQSVIGGDLPVGRAKQQIRLFGISPVELDTALRALPPIYRSHLRHVFGGVLPSSVDPRLPLPSSRAIPPSVSPRLYMTADQRRNAAKSRVSRADRFADALTAYVERSR